LERDIEGSKEWSDHVGMIQLGGVSGAKSEGRQVKAYDVCTKYQIWLNTVQRRLDVRNTIRCERIKPVQQLDRQMPVTVRCIWDSLVALTIT
jgi:hypothetical protein